MKKLLLVFAAMMATCVLYAQQDIKLTVFGQGATKEEATANALRSAIEQTFGVFVSANTQILNDEIIKDEIATIASGNIKEYQELGCVTLPSGNLSVSLAATVSLSNLISYSKSKGSAAEFAGAAFTMNMRMRKLNAENETTALYNMLEQLYILAPSVFDWDLEVGEPAVLSEKMYKIPMIAKAKVNSNTSSFFSLLLNTLESLSLSPSEVEGYKANKMKVYSLKINDREFILRNDFRAFITYVEYLINCIGESFHIYGQLGDKKTKLLYNLNNMLLVRKKCMFNNIKNSATFDINNLNTLMGGAPGAIAFQRNLSVSLDEDALYQVYGFEVVPAPNISRLTFVRKDGMMVVDTMNVYQSVDFKPKDSDRTYKAAFRQMRVLYVSEDCLADYDDIFFYNQDSLKKITVERCGHRDGYGRACPVIELCDNLETVRIGKGIKHVKEITGNPKLSTVIFGSTLTYGDDVIDLTALTEEDLQDIIIFGDDVKTIEPLNRFSKPAESNSLSVVFNRDIACNYGIDFYPDVDICIWLDASRPDQCPIYRISDLLLVPQECLSYFQEKKPNYKYYKVESIEDKMSELGCVDLLSLLKMLSQETVNVK